MPTAADQLRDLTHAKPPTVSLSELARKCGVSREATRQWANGTSKPGSASRKIIEAVLGIPEDAWLDENERRLIESAEADAETDAA